MLTRYFPTGKPFQEFPNPCRILSIDPGLTNFGSRIEDRWVENGKVRTNLVFMEVLDFKNPESDFSLVTVDLVNALDGALQLIKTCSMIVIEEQLSKQNPKMSVISTVLLTYFMLRLERSFRNPIIYIIHTQYVKKYLEIDGRKVDKGQKKKIVNDYIVFLFEKANDQESLKKLSRYKKADQLHLTDSAAQIEAVCDAEGYPTVATRQESLEFIQQRKSTCSKKEVEKKAKGKQKSRSSKKK